MKIKIYKTIIIIGLIIVVATIAIYFIKHNNDLSKEEIYNLKTKEIIRLYKKNLINLDNILSPYERIISSSSSKEDTKNVVLSTYNNENNKVTKCEIISDKKLFYGIDVEWDYSYSSDIINHYEAKVISFKKKYYDYDNDTFYTNNTDIIKDIYDIYYRKYNKIQSEIHSNENNITYKIYYIQNIGGDWNLNDTLELREIDKIINIKTGKAETKEILIKSVEMEGTAL